MVKKLDFEDLQRKLSETQKLLKETKESKLKLEAEVEKLRLPQCLLTAIFTLMTSFFFSFLASFIEVLYIFIQEIVQALTGILLFHLP